MIGEGLGYRVKESRGIRCDRLQRWAEVKEGQDGIRLIAGATHEVKPNETTS